MNENFYKVPVRTEIEVLPGDKHIVIGLSKAIKVSCRGKMLKNSFTLGWTVYETMGIAVVNTGGLNKLTKTTVVK